MLGLVEDARTDVGAQGLAGEELHAPAQDLVEEEGELEEVVVGVRSGLSLRAQNPTSRRSDAILWCRERARTSAG